jgi:hypothetical protein
MTNAIYEHLREMAPHHASFSERERLSIILLSDAKQEIDRLRLTDEEREAVRVAIPWIDAMQEPAVVATLRNLLERTK